MTYRQMYDDEIMNERRARREAAAVTWPLRLRWMAVGIALTVAGVFAFLGKWLG